MTKNFTINLIDMLKLSNAATTQEPNYKTQDPRSVERESPIRIESPTLTKIKLALRKKYIQPYIDPC